MIKTTITEVTEKFDKEGRVIERITRTEKTDDSTDYGASTGQSNLPNTGWKWGDTVPALNNITYTTDTKLG